MGSAVNTVPAQTGSESSTGTAAARPNPVAFETLVTVTGARPSSEGTRDLFTEETRTILVFVDGAVIQLESPVNEGQLLFVTNKKSHEEIVCQVLRKKKFGATAACYVELQFTEEKPKYWGVAFPKGKQRGAEFTVAEHVAAEKTTEPEAGAAPAPHDDKDVEELKTQVEELRKQQAELEKRNEVEAKAQAASAETLQAAGESTKSVDPAPEVRTEKNVQGSASGGEALLMPRVESEKATVPGWAVAMALPTQAKGEAREAAASETDSLPKPELDFSRVSSAATPEEIAARASLKVAPWREKARIAGLVVMLGALGFFAYPRVEPYVSSMIKKAGARNRPASTPTPKPAAAQPELAPGGGLAKGTNAAVPSAAPANANNAKAVGGRGKEETAASPAPAGLSEVKEKAPEPRVIEGAAVRKASGASGRAEKKTPVRETAGEAAVSAVEVAPADAPMTPAKLFHAAQPVYPPDAMRRYITGDVKAELVVDATGRVGEVKVISGPSALRDAALVALKKYEYAPATQGGKAVASKATAVVKFWFNP